MEHENILKAINALMTFIQDMNDDLSNVKGQVKSLQEAFYKKLVETQEPLSEDWAEAQLDELRHKQDGLMGHVMVVVKQIDNLDKRVIDIEAKVFELFDHK